MKKEAVVRSFCGREQELRQCLQTLKDNCDTDGKRSRKRDKWPWIIHGESRCGKSHLARRLLADLSRMKDGRIVIEVPAREQASALKVMSTVFRELVGKFHERVHDQRRTDPLDRPEEIETLTRLVTQTEQFLTDAQGLTESTEGVTEAVVEVGGELGGFLGKLLGKLQAKTSDKQTRQVVLRPPDAYRLAELCRALVEALISRKLARHVLLLVDDVDLLETYQNPRRNPQFERSVLAEALCELHGESGIDVLLTARSWYAYTNKEFCTLIDLTTKPLQPDDLIAIYQRRLGLDGKKYAGFLTLDAVARAAGEMAGLPGVFLSHLQTAHHAYMTDPTDIPRDFDWFVGVFRDQFNALRAKCAPAAEALREAMRVGRLEMTVAEINPFYGTAFDNQFVFQSYYNERCYFAAPIIRRILQEDPSLTPPLSGAEL